MTSIADAKQVGSKARACSEWLRRNERLVAGCVAAALVVPCIWQPHIESVDLPSHVYNAWLASLIAHGQIAGLRLVHPLTNVLADWILSGGLALFGPAWAARILCAIAVEAFFWGTFAFTSVVNGKHAWVMAPCLAMLSYGLVFYFGFLNFYLSTACSVWMLAVLWRFSFRRLLVAILLAVVALLGSPLPVAWAVCAIGYVYAARLAGSRARVVLPCAAFIGLLLAHFVLVHSFAAVWSPRYVLAIDGWLEGTGLGQFLPYGEKYRLAAIGIFIAWFRMFLERIDRAAFLRDPLAQLWLLNSVAFVVCPLSIMFPGYSVPLFFIQERVSLFGVILFCAWVGGADHGHGHTRLLSALAAVYFLFLYADQRALNRVDTEVASVVSAVPRGQRVVVAIRDRDARVSGLERVVDWACIGRCFDYSNYEPSTRQFRVQVTGPNPVVVAEFAEAQAMTHVAHTVTAGEAPLYSVCRSSVPGRRFELRKLEVGEKTCSVSLEVTPPLGQLFW